MDDQQLAIESFDKALAYLDRLLGIIHPFSHFNVSIMIGSSKWTDEDKNEANNLSVFIENLLINKLKYAQEQNGRFWLELTDTGRAAKKAGGHIMYEEKLKRIATRNNKKEDFDVELKRLALKYKFVTFGIPFISLAIAIISIFFTFHKERTLAPTPTQLNLKLTIQSDTQKNILRVDTFLKK